MCLKVLFAKTCSIFLQVEGKYKVRAVTQDGKASKVEIVAIEDILEPQIINFIIKDQPNVKIKPKRRPCPEKPNENPEERDCH